MKSTWRYFPVKAPPLSSSKFLLPKTPTCDLWMERFLIEKQMKANGHIMAPNQVFYPAWLVVSHKLTWPDKGTAMLGD